MSATMVLLILNILFALFLVLGFLFGFMKGLKKSALRLAFFFVSIIIAAIITPYISRLILDIQITYEGSLTSIEDIILSAINNSSAEVSEVMAASPTLSALVENMPVMLVNLVSFVLLCYVLNLVGWVIYLVIASAFFKKNKATVDETGKKVKSKQWRIFGGLVGAAQGLILAFLTFLPLSGIVGMYNDLSTAQAVSADEGTSLNLSLSAQFINENVPDDVKVYLDAYSDSAIAKVSGVLGLDDSVFNQVASVTVNNTKISLRNEVVNIASVYDNVGFLIDVDFSSFDAFKTLDYDRLSTAVDYIFNSKLLTTALPELVDYGFDKLLEMDEVQSEPQYIELIDAVRNVLNSDDGVTQNLKNDISAVISTAKIMADNKIFDRIPSDGQVTESNIEQILHIVSKDNKKVFDQIIDNIFNSKILNKAVIFGLNMGIDALEDELKTLTNNQALTISNIDIKNDQMTLKKGEVKSLLSSAINIANDVIGEDLNSIKDNFLTVFDLDLENIVTNAGSMMNALQNMNVFSSTGIYDQIVTALESTEYNKYVDFEIFKGDNVWLNETSTLSNVISNIRKSQVVSYIEKGQDGNYYVADENFSKMFQNLVSTTEINGETKTLIRQIVEPIYNSNAFSKLIRVGFENLSGVINDFGDMLKEGAQLGEINYDALYKESEKENLFAFVDNVATYLRDIDFSQFKENIFEQILSSNLTQFGRCIDSVRASSIFGDIEKDGTVVNGIYTNLIDTLADTELNQFIDFNCFKDQTFSFSTEFATLQPVIDLMREKTIVYEGENYNLISYILKVGNLENMLDQVTSDDVSNIFRPLMNSRVFRPVGVLVVNSVNAQIKEYVGDLGVDIPVDLDNLTDEQVEEVVDVLASVTDIASDIMNSTSISDLATGENSESLAGLLEKLEDSANSQGVFEGAYDAMLDYIKQDATIGAYVSEVIENNTTDGDVDWHSVITSVKENYGN